MAEMNDGGDVTKIKEAVVESQSEEKKQSPVKPDSETSQVPSQDWWGFTTNVASGWLQKAKAKSVEVYDLVKNDLDEFGSALHTETSSIINYTSESLKEKLNITDEDNTTAVMKRSVSKLLTHVNEVFTPPPADEDQEPMVIRNNEPVILGRLDAQLFALRQDRTTYIDDPSDLDKYETWIGNFDLESRQSECSELMVKYPDIRRMYGKLVPAECSHVQFWHRYYYKVSELEDIERRREELKKRDIKDVGDVVDWDGEEEDIPEDVQHKLLTDYEEECKAREDSKESSEGEWVKPDLEDVSTGQNSQSGEWEKWD